MGANYTFCRYLKPMCLRSNHLETLKQIKTYAKKREECRE